MGEPDVEPARQARGEGVVAVGEDDLVAVDLVVVEAVGREIADRRAVLLFAAVRQVLAHALCPFRLPALGGEGRLGHVAVGGVGRGCRDQRHQGGIHGTDVGHVRGRLVGAQSPPVGGVVRDRSTVGLVAADRELHGAHAECARRGGHRTVGDPVDPRGAPVGDAPVGPIGPDATADAIARLEDDGAPSGIRQQARRGEPRDPGTDDDRIECGHGASLPPGGASLGVVGATLARGPAHPVLRTSSRAASRVARIAAHRSTSSRVPDSSNSNSTGRPDVCDSWRAAAW